MRTNSFTPLTRQWRFSKASVCSTDLVPPLLNLDRGGERKMWRGVLISEGVMYRLQWSWDLKMCPY